MIRLLALLLLCTAAHAAPPCWPLSSESRQLTVTTFPADKMAWIAAPDASFAVTWWCAGEYGYIPNSLVGFRSEMPSDLASMLRVFSSGTEEQKRASWSAGEKCQSDGTADPCAKYATLANAAAQQLGFGQANLAPILWKVRANGASATRPAYLVGSDGKRLTTASAYRAPVGAACSCMALAVKETGGSYCPAPGLPAKHVTLCSRQ